MQINPVTVELLRTFPLLNSLSPQQLEELTLFTELKHLNRRAIIYETDQPSDKLFFLFEGRLQGIDFTIDGREVGLFFVEKGGYCGELALFDQQAYPETLITTVKSTVISVNIQKMRELAFNTPILMSELGERLAGKVRLLNNQRRLLAIGDIPQRVCAQLVLLAKDSSANSISHPPTHQEIAIMLNTSRETVTRIFQRLSTKQLIDKDGAQTLIIKDISALKRIANGELPL
jgi:CRP-like cAMP-binding protein